MKKNIIKYLVLPFAALTMGCADYLSQDPEDFNSLDKVFTSLVQTREWYARIYGEDFMPQNMYYADEVHYFWWSDESACTQAGWIANINRGQVSPGINYGYTIWRDELNNEQNFYYFQRYYQAIRHCNLLLENIDRCTELVASEKATIIAETRFMRAYYHYELFRIYGPIPIVDKSRTSEENITPQARAPMQACFDWIEDEMNWACENGLASERGPNYLGLPTVGAAKAIISRMLLMMASPLYNGNPTYKNWTNKDGTPLLPQTYDANRWKDAADAAKDIIDNYGYTLHKPAAGASFEDIVDNYREITTTWNSEAIWSWPNTSYWYIMRCMPARWYGWNGRYSLAAGQVNSYFMADGSKSRPLEEWFADKRFSTTRGNGTIEDTFWMFVDREPRFYASIHFPNMRVSYASPNINDPNTDAEGYGIVDFWYSGLSGNSVNAAGDKNTSGFSPRKNIPLGVESVRSSSHITWPTTPFPIIRLGEVYLNYVEALNEYNPGHSDILIYLNEIRTRAGIPGYDGTYTQDEMREMIHAERRVELAWECNRFFDVRRWFTAHGPEGLFNQDEYGMDMSKGTGPTDPEFFTLTRVAYKSFGIQHYFLPISAKEVSLNTDLVQAPFY